MDTMINTETGNAIVQNVASKVVDKETAERTQHAFEKVLDLDNWSAVATGISNRKRELLLADAYNTEQFGIAGANLTSQSGALGAIGTGLGGAADFGGKLYNLADKEGWNSTSNKKK